MKFYIYISDSKIEMMYPQLPTRFLAGVSGELKVSLGVVSSTLKQGSEAESRYSKLAAISAYLENEGLLGDVDNPKQYFRGSMPMKWGPYGALVGPYKGLVYFGAETSATILGLGGSDKHLIGATGTSQPHSASATPILVRELLGGVQDASVAAPTPDQGMGTARSNGSQLREAALAVELATMQMEGLPENLEFIARRLHFIPNGSMRSKVKKNVLLGTPLYVAAC